METKTTINIKEENWSAKTFITKKDKLPFDKLSQFFGKSYGAIYGELQKKGIVVTQPPCAFYYSLDEKNNTTELAAAVNVTELDVVLPGFEKVILPPCKVIATTHIGTYESMRPVYEEMDNYVTQKGLKKGLIIEEYVSDPEKEKDQNKWVTNIYFIVR